MGQSKSNMSLSENWFGLWIGLGIAWVGFGFKILTWLQVWLDQDVDGKVAGPIGTQTPTYINIE